MIPFLKPWKQYLLNRSDRKGMSTPLKILFGAVLTAILLFLIVTIAYNLLNEGSSMTDILSLDNWLSGGSS